MSDSDHSSADTMKVELNGEERSFPGREMELPALLAALGFAGRPVLVELNGMALNQRDHGSTTVRDGDRLEIIMIVAGG